VHATCTSIPKGKPSKREHPVHAANVTVALNKTWYYLFKQLMVV